MNTVEKRRFTDQELTERAKSKLISQQRCSKRRDDYYNVICYGMDSTVLDQSRKWIYEQELKAGSDHATIIANKMVLYVNQNDLQVEVQKLRSRL